MKKTQKANTPKGHKLSASQLKTELLKFFQQHPRKSYNAKQLLGKLKVLNNRDAAQHALDQLAEENRIAPVGDFKYQLKRQYEAVQNDQFYTGVVDMTRTGDAYIVTEQLTEDVHIIARNLNTALNGDKVKIRVWKPRGASRMKGEVMEIVERAREHFMGTLWLYPRHAIVSLDTHFPFDIGIDLANTLGAQDGDKVVVKIEEWTSKQFNHPTGVVTSVLGKAGSHDIEMKSILINNGFDLDFSPQTLEEAEQLPGQISVEEIARRLDMREVPTFTIDPENARDFDDALSLRFLETGESEVGVHIADVTHFVQPNTFLDKEAYKRSTSVYLVDRVLPMLPERLSNDLCSLRPHEDRLAFSAIFRFDKNGKIVHRWFGRTVIHSNRRFTYQEAQEVLESQSGDFAEELQFLNRLAVRMRKQRFKQGAINFETDEVQFRLDEKGTPIEVYIKERKEAHLLIEDFMLLANREVATYMAEKGKEAEIPFVYRVHDEPDPDKVIELARFAREMGFQMNINSPKDIALSYNRLVEATEENPALKLLGPLAIRTMAKAVYSSENIGHYGLGFQYYTHFTSPIRRYSDVMAHRLLDWNLGKDKVFRANKATLEEQCKYVSQQEKRAADAERESVKYKQVEYMQNHLGEVFKGFISGMMDRGFFVELEGTRIEGMVPFETLNEPFEISESRLKLRGLHSGLEYKMGDIVEVKIARTDLTRRQIEMAWVRDEIALASSAHGRAATRRTTDRKPKSTEGNRRRRKKG